ncbi:MAG: M4 family metallopeptidase, partial [Gaiellales bacterium]
ITVGVDPRDMQPFTNAKDVIAHELAHRIVHHMVKQPLSMSATSADVAIHETLADTFASLVDDKDWIIGDKLSEPIRVMNDPGQLGHPGHVEDLARVMAPDSPFMHPVGKSARTGKTVLAPDWHAVAGIPNRAASIIGDALGREKLGKIYFQAVREHLQPGKQLQGLAAAVLLSAQDLYGAESREFKTTADAWAAVGVLDQSRAA